MKSNVQIMLLNHLPFRLEAATSTAPSTTLSTLGLLPGAGVLLLSESGRSFWPCLRMCGATSFATATVAWPNFVTTNQKTQKCIVLKTMTVDTN